jgi:hypothetical protein
VAFYGLKKAMSNYNLTGENPTDRQTRAVRALTDKNTTDGESIPACVTTGGGRPARFRVINNAGASTADALQPDGGAVPRSDKPEPCPNETVHCDGRESEELPPAARFRVTDQ